MKGPQSEVNLITAGAFVAGVPVLQVDVTLAGQMTSGLGPHIFARALEPSPGPVEWVVQVRAGEL